MKGESTTPLPSIMVHHEHHPSHLRVGASCCPLSLSWWDLCPSPHLHCLSQTAHSTLPMGFNFPLLHSCTLRAPKAKIYSLLCSAKLPLGHFPILLQGHSVTTSPARGVASPPRFLSLPCFLFPSSGAEGRSPIPVRLIHLQRILLSGRRDGTPENPARLT